MNEERLGDIEDEIVEIIDALGRLQKRLMEVLDNVRKLDSD